MATSPAARASRIGELRGDGIIARMVTTAPARCDRWMFALGAAWTVGIGATVMAAPRWAGEVFYRHDGTAEEPLLWMTTRDFGLGLVLFGLGYALVAIAPDTNRGFVQLGAVGKVLVVAAMIQRFTTGIATHWVLVVALGDLVFAALYARFLWRTRGGGPSAVGERP
jgi:hypothetical protein